MSRNLSTVKIEPGASRGRKGAYHHGDLRQTLCDTALRMIEDVGHEAVSLRALADSAGVSPTAPYAHFRDKRALLAAAAETGFVRLKARMLGEEEGGGTPRERLIRAGEGYVAFALEAPGLFRLMFNRSLYPVDDLPSLRTAANEAYQVLAVCAADLWDTGPRSADPAVSRAAAWSLLHGLAMLLVEGQIPVPPDGATALAHQAMQHYLGDVAGGPKA